MDRRGFLKIVGAASIGSAVAWDSRLEAGAAPDDGRLDLRTFEKARVLRLADSVLDSTPGSVTASRCERSAGGPHDFYSEGDYWWPDPNHPAGPYIQRDGMSNPDNFGDHRRAMVRLSRVVPVLAAAHCLTLEGRYADAAARHLRVWFLDEQTRMNPNLLYGQAIKGRCTGRGIGIIDTLHLAEVAQSVLALGRLKALPEVALQGLKAWFSEYLTWITTHPYGQDERKAQNNHATAWVLQAAAFARLAGSDVVLDQCRELFVNKLLDEQVEADGRFPRELARTKPYCYSLFNLDVMGVAAHVLSVQGRDLWTVRNAKGAGLDTAMAFHYPFIEDKSRWPYRKDVAAFDLFPVRMPALLLAGLALREPRYIDLWKRLNPDPTDDEVIRNFPVRQPVLWA
jgi:hypothetical protein